MSPNSFKEKDSKNLVKFLNLIADKGKFELEVKEVIEFYGLLAWAQQELKKKIESNIVEVLAVHEPTPKKSSKSKGKK